MIGISSKRIIACLLFCSLFCLSGLTAKNILNIRHVKKTYAIKNSITGEYDRIGVGDVFFEDVENGVKFYCDSVFDHADTRILEAFGNVRINQGDTLSIVGEYMSYNQLTDFVKIRKNACLKHIRATLYTDSLDYDMVDRVGYYKYGGKLIDSLSVLTSEVGVYKTQQEEAFFKKNVVITGDDYTIKTDSLNYLVKYHKANIVAPTRVLSKEYDIYTEQGVYNTETGVSNFTKSTEITHKEQTLKGDKLIHDSKNKRTILEGNCLLRDTVNHINLHSDYIYRDELIKRVLFTKNILLEYVMEKDTLFAHSDTILLNQEEESNEKLEIFHHVKFFKKDFQGVCDSMSFVAQDSMLNMYQNPVIWSGENQMTSDTIKAKMSKKSLEHIDMIQNAFVASTDSYEDKFFNQMKGRNMRGFVEQDTLRKIEVYGNGESIYFMKEKEEHIGFNVIKCSDITVRMKKGKLNSVVFRVSPVGTTYPMSYKEEIPIFLRGFRWEEANKPNNPEDVFKWNDAQPLDFIKEKKRSVIKIDDEQKVEIKNEVL